MKRKERKKPDNSSPLTAEIQGKLRQFHRVLMSYIDLQEAAQISSYVLEAELHKGYPRQNRLLLRALNCAAIISYCRPFSGNDPGANPKIPDLPGRFVKVLTAEEREVHDKVMDDRNTVLAHSDSQAWYLKPQLLRVGGKEVLLPMHHDVHAPLTREATVIFNRICVKLREAVFEERQRLEPQIRGYLQVVEPDRKELERVAAELGLDLPTGDPS